MNKFWKYIAGVVAALKGKYPYEQLEHLEYLKKVLKHDDDSLNAEHPAVMVITARHASITGTAWRSAYVMPHSSLRRKLNKIDEKETPQFPGWISQVPDTKTFNFDPSDPMMMYRQLALSEPKKPYRLDRILAEPLPEGKCFYSNLQEQIYRNFQGSDPSEKP